MEKQNDLLEVQYLEERLVYKKNLFALADLIGFHDLGECHKVICKVLRDTAYHKRRLFLFPRGHFKTSLISNANIVQYILNNPDIRILLASSTFDNAKKSLRIIKNVFWQNEDFRKMFPEFCPSLDTKEFGTQEQFTIPNRINHALRESTVECCGVGMTITGRHFDKIVLTDIVTQETIGTPGQIQKTKDWVALLEPILNKPGEDTIDVEGTVYDYDDFHMDWLRKSEKDPKNFFCYKRPAILTVDDEDGKAEEVSLFPERFSLKDLKDIRQRQGDYHFSSQYMLNPIDEKTAPFKRKNIKWVARRRLPNPLPNRFTTIDLAMGQSSNSDYTCITTSVFNKFDYEHVIDIQYGRWSVNEIIKKILAVNERHHPHTMAIETVSFQKLIADMLYDISKLEGILLPIHEMKRDTTQSKQMRIMQLTARFAQNRIVFCDDLDKQFIENQILRFDPNKKHNKDDLLDTLSDMEKIKIIEDVDFNVRDFYPHRAYIEWLEGDREEGDDFYEDEYDYDDNVANLSPY
jgi:predicted phage terminase large subunit-like protein